MKPMSKILVLLALLIFSVVMASGGVVADNHAEVNDRDIEQGEYLLLEADFTHGSSAFVDIEIASVNSMNVYFIPGDSIGGFISGGTWYKWTTYSVSGVYTYDMLFTLDLGTDDWLHQTNYFVIEPSGIDTITVDVGYHVWIDYDDDGLYGDEDDDPIINKYWAEGIENRLAGMESNLTLNCQWMMENITALSSSLGNLEGSISDEFLIIRDDLDLKFSGLLGELETLRVDIWDGLENNVTSLQEKITTLRSLLSTLEIQISEICNTMDETTGSIESEIVALSDALNTTDEWLQDLEDYIMVRMASLDTELNDGVTTLNRDLIELSDREKDNNFASAEGNKAARAVLKEAQEDIENALDEAEASRKIGLVTGLIGIILAVVAIVLIIRSKK